MLHTDALRYTKAHRLDDPYVVAGRKSYLIATQDGRFPDIDGHVPKEMGGLWSHPIKVLDGFWLGLGKDLSDVAWLPPADLFETSPVAVRHDFPQVLGYAVSRETWIPHDEEALVVTHRFARKATPDAPAGAAPETLPVIVLFRTDMQGVWLSERLGWKNGVDQAALLDDAGEGQHLVHAWDSEMPFHTVIGPALQAGPAAAGVSDGSGGRSVTVRRVEIGHDLWGPQKTHGQGVSVAYLLDLPVDENRQAALTFVVSSSSRSAQAARETWLRVSADLAGLRAEKEQAIEEILSRSRIEIPDPDVQGVFDDIKVGYEQLYRHVDGFGKGLGAGLPVYPWWFGCDSSYALLGALCVGRFEMALDTLRLLAKVSRETNGNGRIIHEVTTNGVVFNPGNTQETPHFVMAVWDAFCWTGDEEFLRELYPLCREGVMEWLLGTQDTDGDLFPEGYGITEVAGLNWELLDTAVYTHGALVALAEMAAHVGDETTAQKARELAPRVARAIEERYWLEDEGLYADLIAPPRMMMERLPQIRGQKGYQSEAMSRRLDEVERICRESDPDQERPWLFKTWVVFCPVETGIAGKDRALRALRRMETSEFSGRFGLYLSGYSQTHQMTISTGVAAVSEARYRRMDAALSYIRQIASTRFLRLPGAPSEMSPDYGCFVQAWTGYGVAVPLVRHFFGLSPLAHEKRIGLSPCLPQRWEKASLKAVRVGDRAIDLYIAVDKEQARIEVEIAGLGEDWTVDFQIDPAWFGLAPGEYTLSVNGAAVPVTTAAAGSESASAAALADVSATAASPATEGAPATPADGAAPYAARWKSRGRDLVVLAKSS